MKYAIICLTALLLVAGGFVLHLYYVAGEFKTLEPHFDGELQKVFGVVGAEDITIHPETGVAYISTDDRRARAAGKNLQGAIYAYDLKAENPELVNLTKDFRFEFHPHGISLLAGEGDAQRLFVINHRQDGPFVEIFEINHGALQYIESVQHELMHSPNDVVAVGERSFYATNDHGNRSEFGRTVEEYLILDRANVVYFDGEDFKEVASGIRLANGINKSPDGSQIYVASTTSGKIYIFTRDIPTGNLNEKIVIKTDTAVDNIEIDRDGNLWVAGHPKLLSFIKHSKDKTKRSPSQVLKISISGKNYHIEERFLDTGENLSGSSVAAPFENKLLIGSVFEDRFLICTLPETKKTQEEF